MAPTEARPTAVLVAVQLPGVSDEEHAADVQELGRLVRTLGYDVAATVSQRRARLAKGAVVGRGRLAELCSLTGGPGENGKKKDGEGEEPEEAPEEESAEERAPQPLDEELPEDARGPAVEPLKPRPALVAVDHELSPSQARNLEKASGLQVLDRTGVIVELFHRHARSREARLQVELARLAYVAPRLREAAVGRGERQAGRGAGERGLELDRRKVRDRMAELRRELEQVAHEQKTRRSARKQLRRVALVGYTNAGKSSLMRALTGSEVLVEDKLFATLDTTVRALQPEAHPRILVSDTVGFIKKLPHDLVASFRSTLDEALEASLLLYVVDASDPTYESQLAVTRGVLAELGATEAPSLLVLNKCDRLTEAEREALRERHPEALQVSAHDRADVARLRETLLDFFDRDLREVELRVPYDRQSVVADARAHARIVSESYDEQGAVLRVRADEVTLARLERSLA